MASKIVVGLSTYLIDFANGQAAFRTPPYTQYSTDHDTNYITLRNKVNEYGWTDFTEKTEVADR